MTLDSIRSGAYIPRVTLPSQSRTGSGATAAARGKARRRPAAGAEQARRQAWGKKYGTINAAFWRDVHTKERGT